MKLSRRQESSGCAAGTSTVAGMQGMKSDLAELDVTLLVVDMLKLLLQGCQLCLQLLHQQSCEWLHISNRLTPGH